MTNFIILGATSNICSIRIFDNLNNMSSLLNKIYCYGWEKWNTSDFLIYFKNNIFIKNENQINSKISFISGDYNYDSYKKLLSDKIDNDTIIYVSTPPLCYNEIIKYIKSINKDCKLILEKPLAINYKDFNLIKSKLTNNCFMIDHFLYKRDIINVINKNKNKDYKIFKIQFNYTDDVEKRIGYFDNTGFFIDMFQSHFLSIIHSIIKENIYSLLNINIIKNIRKQYNGYTGKNNADTYFYLEFESDNKIYIFEAGKAMKEDKKIIIIDNLEFKINNYEDEYEIYFKNMINNKVNNNLIYYQDIFWKITEIVSNNFNTNYKLQFYDKNKLSSSVTN